MVPKSKRLAGINRRVLFYMTIALFLVSLYLGFTLATGLVLVCVSIEGGVDNSRFTCYYLGETILH